MHWLLHCVGFNSDYIFYISHPYRSKCVLPHILITSTIHTSSVLNTGGVEGEGENKGFVKDGGRTWSARGYLLFKGYILIASFQLTDSVEKWPNLIK